MIFLYLMLYLFVGFVSTFVNYRRLPQIDNPIQAVALFVLWPVFLIQILLNLKK